MNRGLIALLIVASAAAGCSRIADSALNPFNWFGRSRSVEVANTYSDATDPRPLIQEVTRLAVEPTPGGAILRATGLPPVQGYFDGALISVSDGLPVDGVLEFDFRAIPPLDPTRSSTVQSREIVVGLHLTSQDLASVRRIQVNGAENARVASR